MTADAWLLLGIGPEGQDRGGALVRFARECGALVRTENAAIVIALLSVLEGDAVDTRGIGALLRITAITMLQECSAERAVWSLPPGAVEAVRSKALGPQHGIRMAAP